MEEITALTLTNWFLSKMFQSLLVLVMAIAAFILFSPDFMYSLWHNPKQALTFLPTFVLPAAIIYYFEIGPSCFGILIAEITAYVFWKKIVQNEPIVLSI